MKIGKVFFNGGDVHYILPRFQRAYAWEQRHWQTLWEDVLAVHESQNQSHEHFLGAMVVIEEGMVDGTLPVFKLVDGQQRLLTISILLRALWDRMQDKRHRRRTMKYLMNEDRDGDLSYKILPTDNFGDRGVWRTLLTGGKVDENSKSLILSAYDYFSNRLVKVLQHESLETETLFNTIVSRLQIVFISLEREARPHQVFESLNAKGLDLSQADLVRNYLAMRLPARVQDRVFEQYWLSVQDMFDDRKSDVLSLFLLDFLARMTGRVFNRDQVFLQFRNRMDREFSETKPFVAEVATMHRHADFYRRLLKPKTEQNVQLRRRLQHINALERAVVYPLLMSLYDAHHGGRFSSDDLCEAFDVVENYLTRHFLAGLPTNALRRFLAGLTREKTLTDLKQRLHSGNYPSDYKLRHVLQELDLYKATANRRRLAFILMRVNDYLLQGRDTITLKDRATVEHIMPQQPGTDWQQELGPDHERVHRDLLNKLGNLTVVTQEYNSRMSNRPWDEKRIWLENHGLPLNSQYPWPERWDEEAIQNRTKWLVERLCRQWPNLAKDSGGMPDIFPVDANRHPRPGSDYTGKKVRYLSIGEQFWDRNWNELPIVFSEAVAVPHPDFEEIAEQLPGWFDRESKRKYDHQLSNGWWVKNGQSANNTVEFCIDLAALCEIPDTDWQITLK